LRIRQIMKRAKWPTLIAALILAGLASTQLWSPYLARIRGPAIACLCLAGAWFILCGARGRSRAEPGLRPIAQLLIGALLIGLPGAMEKYHQGLRVGVLSTPVGNLECFSRHFVLGYRSFEEISTVLSHMELGGIYLTARNVRGKHPEQIRAEVAALQAIQRSRGRPPLLVMADQEGGLVSRLSPPLPQRPNLGQVLSTVGQGDWQTAVVDHARAQAEDLARLGVNCNLSPVVDLKDTGAQALFDLHTKLSERATSADPQRTAEAAQLYALTLRQHGCLAVAKHFPGLGYVAQDTHHFDGRLTRSMELLQAEDFRPFETQARSDAAAVMVGHVRVEAIDPQRLASTSAAVIRGVLRGKLGHTGLVLTDDLCMAPTFYAKGGIGASAGRALAASADLVLVTYEPEMFYPAMASLLNAPPELVPSGALEASRWRLARVQRRLEAN
jgi:beta-N-acetylhexosaminidase